MYLHTHTGQGWARLRSGAGHSTRVSHTGGRDPTAGVAAAAARGPMSRKLQSGAGGGSGSQHSDAGCGIFTARPTRLLHLQGHTVRWLRPSPCGAAEHPMTVSPWQPDSVSCLWVGRFGPFLRHGVARGVPCCVVFPPHRGGDPCCLAFDGCVVLCPTAVSAGLNAGRTFD